VPFCVRRCSYCDFAVEAVREPPVAAWLESVERELVLLAAEQGWEAPLPVDTVYVGGGTPSLLGGAAMAELGQRLRSVLTWDPAAVEWTCEANPESFTPEVADGWRAAGVNRISLGVQTFHEPTLGWMGRLHGADGPGRAMRTARAAGFDNVSVDLIFALPRRLGREWAADLDRALALEPEHVSLYGLTAEPGAPLGRWVEEGRETLADDDAYADEYLLAHRRLAEAGFRHYEVSNFARDGLLSRHNFVYWTGAPYAALGPGAHGFYPPVRRWNMRRWDAYREAVAAGRLPTEGEETIGAEEAALERAWLLLRTDRGFPLTGATSAQLETAREWVRFGWAATEGGVLRLTPEGWLLLDRLAVEFASVGTVPDRRVGSGT
jgi:oxygen-independent coproporphyrinogen III oxidase